MSGDHVRRAGRFHAGRGPRTAALCAAVLGAALSAARCDAGGTSAPGPEAPPSRATEWFVDRGAAAGLDFVHVNGMTGELYLAEIMGAGVGLVDYDNDGDLDVYAVQGGSLAPAGNSAAGTGDRLYRNDLRHGDPATLTFTDVTAASGIDVRTYGMGVATGDVDNDGWVDLYLTRLGADVLLRNNRNGTFTDITRESGITETGWSVPASFFDIDRDGWLDLYVGGYVHYDVSRDSDCRGANGAVDYCTPQVYSPAPGRLYRNRGGRFVDVTSASGIAGEYGPALGSVAADVDGDGWTDLFVANDGSANQLWLNQRNGTFRNGALLAGVAMSAAGRTEGSMGVDAGDYDHDGDEDLVFTNLFGEGTALYVNDGTGLFEDRGAASRVRPSSLRLTGFGVAWADLDNDGWLDAPSVNGAVQLAQPYARADDPVPLAQPLQLLRNRGDGTFDDVTEEAGRALTTPIVGRGAAYGDIDNDGDIDIVVSANNGPLKLLVNQTNHRRRWVGLRLTTAAGRPALGARVGIVGSDGIIRWRRIHTDGSYASANDPRALVGLGDAAAAPVRAIVVWPDGTRDERTIDALDRWITITQRES